MIRPHGEGLILEQLLYPDELRSFEDVPLEDGEVDEGELALAMQLIQQASSEGFEPEKYRDEVRERVLGLIEKKIEGEQITMAPQEEPETKIIDLMEALKASLDTGGERKGPTRAKGKAGGKKKASRKKASSG